MTTGVLVCIKKIIIKLQHFLKLHFTLMDALSTTCLKPDSRTLYTEGKRAIKSHLLPATCKL